MPTFKERMRGFLSPTVGAGKVARGQIVGPFARGLSAFQEQLPAPNDDNVLQRFGGSSVKFYDTVLDNATAQYAFQQRRLAVVSRPWEVEAGADDPQSKAAADHLREQIENMRWDEITDKMLYGVWYGYAVGECIYARPSETADGKVWLADVVVPDRSRFLFDGKGRLKLSDTLVNDQMLPDRKFWVYRTGATHDHAFYGRGLAHWCYWPAWFARNGMNFWSIFLEKFAQPTAVGKYPGQATETEKSQLLGAVQALGTEAAITIPETMKVELVEAARQGSTSAYTDFLERCDREITRIVLSQNMTTEDGSSRSQAEVHKDVRDEVVRADSDLLCAAFNNGPALWLTQWNFPGAVPPRVYRIMDDPDDLDALVLRDKALYEMGYKRDPQKLAEIYGEGYIPREDMQPVVDPNAPEPQFAADGDHPVDVMVAAMADAGDDAIRALVAPLKAALAGATTVDEANAAVQAAFSQMDEEPLARLLARTGLSVRVEEAA